MNIPYTPEGEAYELGRADERLITNSLLGLLLELERAVRALEYSRQTQWIRDALADLDDFR